MTVDLELCYRGAGELAALIRERRLSPVEAVSNALARIGQVNPALNCFCFVWHEPALARAREAEAQLMRGGSLPPLLGVPIAFKDLTPTKGQRTTLGSRAFEHWLPEQDAIVVEKLTAAGAIVVGKTTTPEFAHAGLTESPLWGITRNPWDPARTPGGSSGGAGVAVASGCVPLAEGSDMGGSVRIPASLCGTVGLKPSFGRIPFEILPSQFDWLNHFGPLARSVDDAALFLQYAQGPDDRDIASLPCPVDFSAGVPRSAQGLRLAISEDLGFFAVEPQVARRFQAAVAALRQAGAEIEPVALPWTAELVDRWYDLWKVFMAGYFGHLLPEWRDRLDPTLVRLVEAGHLLGAVEVQRIQHLQTRMWRQLQPILARCHALLSPTCAITAPAVGQTDEALMGFTPDGKMKSLDMTAIFNLVSPCPALSVPAGLAEDGLPVGLQIVARRHDDLLALRIGAALEDAIGGFRRPPAFEPAA